MANKRIVSVLILLSIMFLSLIGYLTYIELFQKEKLVSNPYNQRQWDDEHGTIRGTIFAADGVTLAKTVYFFTKLTSSSSVNELMAFPSIPSSFEEASPISFATESAVARLSPVIITGFIFASLHF